jgi:hypothetical protein
MDPADESAGLATIWQRVLRAIRKMEADGVRTINPTTVADLVSPKLTPDLKVIAEIMHLRQTAREILRRVYPEKGAKGEFACKSSVADEREPVFPGPDFSLLQRRYPKAHKEGGERGYTPRDNMTEEDWRWNVSRFDRESRIKRAHRDQLILWGITVKGFTLTDDDEAAAK